MKKDFNRISPVITVKDPIDDNLDIQLLADYDRMTAEQAIESLTKVENRLRETSPWRFIKRANLQATARSQRQQLIALGASISPGVPSLTSRAVKSFGRGWSKISPWRRYSQMSWRQRKNVKNLGWSITAFLACIGVFAAIMFVDTSPSPQETAATRKADAQKRRAKLETFVVYQEKWRTSKGKGKYTTDTDEIMDEFISQSDHHAYDDFYNMEKNMDVQRTIDGRGVRVTSLSGPRFNLEMRPGIKPVGTCAAPVDHGCVEGRWYPDGIID